MSNPNEEYAYELCQAYWPGLPRRDFDAYSALGVDAAQLLELEWQDVIEGGPLLRWQDMNAASQLDKERIRDFYDHGFGLVFELLRGIGVPGEMGEQEHRGNVVHLDMLGNGGHGPILDYGGGIGQQSIFLARQGWEVAYADLGETAEFARWRFGQEDLLYSPLNACGIMVLSSPEAALEKLEPPWGAICALDVVEHVPEPVDLLQRLTGALAPDGLLFLTRHSFKEYPAHLPETAVLQATLDDVLAAMGYGLAIVPDGHFGIGAWRRL